ncbi:MAG: PD-(D/E)XK nuclease family protein [Desulfobacca sp.]|uniref:PD-(D/E)XK nuclease family protein n=1 Tax=Desulfobacca sp. TaxID=2067990 RepID=UPI00404ADB4E
MTTPGISRQGFNTSAALQEFLLRQKPGGLVVVPHIRVAHQVWRRQRLAARSQGVAAWEPLAMTTLTGWWQQLWQQAWLPWQRASVWQRLVSWQQVLEATPFQGQVLADLAWAALLDETYDLIQRYQLPAPDAKTLQSPFIAWRQTVFQKFATLAAQEGMSIGAHVPQMLLQALAAGQLHLPDYLVVVGLETLAPWEEHWLRAVAKYRPVLRLQLWGRRDGESQLLAAALPDQRQELEWVVTQLLELAQKHPPHRVALTAPNLEDYLPALRRLLPEVLGPAATAAGGLYNFSLGPTLADTCLFQAAFLPLRFILGGEQRQDLLAWLQSPYYGAWRDWQKTFLNWDLTWRENNLGYGWASLKRAGQGLMLLDAGEAPIDLIDQALGLLTAGPAPLATWQERLLQLWRLLAFPLLTNNAEGEAWHRLQGLLADLAQVSSNRLWSAAEVLEWLRWGAARQDLPGPGTSEAGVQIQGLLELQGLDYDVIFCLGLNMGIFPPPPRTLPLLTYAERAAVWGGTFGSQYQFAEISYRYLQAAAPHLILTRPLIWQEEERLASQLVAAATAEQQKTFTALGQLHVGWLRSPAVRAALRHPEAEPLESEEECLTLTLPDHLPLSALERALACPCQFFLADLLGLTPLPEEEAGLPAIVRGQTLHQVVYRFTKRYGGLLKQTGSWQDKLAGTVLQAVAAKVAADRPADPHWQAEVARWLGAEDSLLWRWLAMEKERYLEGWRWLALEQFFGDLRLPGWPTGLRGRIDRLDVHPKQGLMLWDYKTGEILSKKALTEELRQFQLVGYLAAVQHKCLPVPPGQALRAGIIGLKSTRSKHLKYEDYGFSPQDWQVLAQQKMKALSQVGQQIAEGRISPEPKPAPPRRDSACQYCPFALLCWYEPPAVAEEAP